MLDIVRWLELWYKGALFVKIFVPWSLSTDFCEFQGKLKNLKKIVFLRVGYLERVLVAKTWLQFSFLKKKIIAVVRWLEIWHEGPIYLAEWENVFHMTFKFRFLLRSGWIWKYPNISTNLLPSMFFVNISFSIFDNLTLLRSSKILKKSHKTPLREIFLSGYATIM